MSTVNHLEAEQLALGLCLTSAVLAGRGGRAAARSHPIHPQSPTPHQEPGHRYRAPLMGVSSSQNVVPAGLPDIPRVSPPCSVSPGN